LIQEHCRFALFGIFKFIGFKHFERLLIEPLFRLFNIDKSQIGTLHAVGLVNHSRLDLMALYSLHVIQLSRHIVRCDFSLATLFTFLFGEFHHLPTCLAELVLMVLTVGWD
jgi:hypothetical protein